MARDWEKKRAQEKVYREANKDKRKARDKARRASNKDKIAAQLKSYREANKERIAAYSQAHYEANKDKRMAQNKTWRRANQGRATAIVRRRQTAQLCVCPSWSRRDPRIDALYEICAWLRGRGEKVVVDHVFPLKPRCQNEPQGLHVYANLRIVHEHENLRKKNRQPTTHEIVEQRGWHEVS